MFCSVVHFRTWKLTEVMNWLYNNLFLSAVALASSSNERGVGIIRISDPSSSPPAPISEETGSLVLPLRLVLSMNAPNELANFILAIAVDYISTVVYTCLDNIQNNPQVDA